MAIYKIFPEKSATLYSYYPTLNSGLDEVLELSCYKTITDTNEVSRPIIKFSQEEIADILNNEVSGANYDAYLKLSLANASQIPLEYTIYCYPLVESWNRGTGRSSNQPITTDGVSWKYTNYLGGLGWVNFPTNEMTGSYPIDNEGGGYWWKDYGASQSFSHDSSLDLSLKLTNIVNAWFLDSDDEDYVPNNGIILKHSDSLEFVSSSKFELKYFSSNTHTIYPPCLEIRWDDWSYNTGSLPIVSSPNIVATLANNPGEFQQGAKHRFRINVRDQYPARAFQTTSVYLNNKALPTSSYYAIKDLDTEEIVVDYDTTYTKISCDSTGMYFDVYMNGLEPERYYQILIKTIIDGSTLILDNNYYFKVIR
jgi:hypothetical protein